MTEDDLLQFLSDTFGPPSKWPDAVRLLRGVYAARQGVSVGAAAKAAGTNAKSFERHFAEDTPVWSVLATNPSLVTDDHRRKATLGLGQMLLGRAAERVFIDLYKEAMATEELELIDESAEGTDTDYVVQNGRKRKVFRINIKYFGSVFRKAEDLVGLDPLDCFALATYKIRNAVQKQDAQGLPFFFAIVGVPNLTRVVVGEQIPDAVRDVAALILSSGVPYKRDFEDQLVTALVDADTPIYRQTYQQIRDANWYILSARRAELLTKEKLWDRVYSLRVRAFAQNYRGAEVDMHFSLSEDLTPLPQFFTELRTGGTPRLSVLLERGQL